MKCPNGGNCYMALDCFRRGHCGSLPVKRPSFQTSELLDELKRELRQRHRLYPRLISTNKLTEKQGDRQIEMLEAIMAILDELDEAERLL